MCTTSPHRSAWHGHAVGQQDTHRHLALAPQPALHRKPPCHHSAANMHATASEGNLQIGNCRTGAFERACAEIHSPLSATQRPEQAIRGSVVTMVMIELSTAAISPPPSASGRLPWATHQSHLSVFGVVTLYRRHQTMHQPTLHMYRTVARTGVPGSPTGVAPPPFPRV
jgi:hypothetical protein